MTANVPPNQTVYVNNLPEKLKKDGKLLTLAHTTDSLFFSFSFYLPLPPFPSSPLSPSAVTSAGGWCVFAPSLQIATSFLPRYSLVFYCMDVHRFLSHPTKHETTKPKSGSKRSPWSPGHSHLLLLPSSPSSSTRPLCPPTVTLPRSPTPTPRSTPTSRPTDPDLHLHLYTYTYTYTYIHTYIQILSPFPPPLSPPLPLPLLFFSPSQS